MVNDNLQQITFVEHKNLLRKYFTHTENTETCLIQQMSIPSPKYHLIRKNAKIKIETHIFPISLNHELCLKNVI